MVHLLYIKPFSFCQSRSVASGIQMLLTVQDKGDKDQRYPGFYGQSPGALKHCFCGDKASKVCCIMSLFPV